MLAAVIDKDQTIQVLRDQVRALEQAQNERDRYQGRRRARRHYFVYKLRAPTDPKKRADEPVHFLCQTCFDAGKKSVLLHNGDGYWFCHLCEKGRRVSPEGSCGARDASLTPFEGCGWQGLTGPFFGMVPCTWHHPSRENNVLPVIR